MVTHQLQLLFFILKPRTINNLLNENATLSQIHDPAVTVLNQMLLIKPVSRMLKSMCLFADSCTLLDYSEGTLAGKECGLVKRFGVPKKEVFGGQKFELKVHFTSRAATPLLLRRLHSGLRIKSGPELTPVSKCVMHCVHFHPA